MPLHAIQQANPEIYALTINAAPNLHLGSPPPVIPRPLQNPPLGFGEIAAGHLIDPSLTSPYTQQMSLGFARQLGKNLAVELTYVHVLLCYDCRGSFKQAACRCPCSSPSFREGRAKRRAVC